jgi:uncharacterized protein (DUF1330 family)
MLVQAKITDPVRFRSYAEIASRLVKKFGGRYIVLGGESLQLEGVTTSQKCVISEWPDIETALQFWNSPEYAEAKLLREGTGEFDVRLIKGWE